MTNTWFWRAKGSINGRIAGHSQSAPFAQTQHCPADSVVFQLKDPDSVVMDELASALAKSHMDDKANHISESHISDEDVATADDVWGIVAPNEREETKSRDDDASEASEASSDISSDPFMEGDISETDSTDSSSSPVAGDADKTSKHDAAVERRLRYAPASMVHPPPPITPVDPSFDPSFDPALSSIA